MHCRIEASEAHVAEAGEAAAISDNMQTQLQHRLAALQDHLQQVGQQLDAATPAARATASLAASMCSISCVTCRKQG